MTTLYPDSARIWPSIMHFLVWDPWGIVFFPSLPPTTTVTNTFPGSSFSNDLLKTNKQNPQKSLLKVTKPLSHGLIGPNWDRQNLPCPSFKELLRSPFMFYLVLSDEKQTPHDLPYLEYLRGLGLSNQVHSYIKLPPFLTGKLMLFELDKVCA